MHQDAIGDSPGGCSSWRSPTPRQLRNALQLGMLRLAGQPDSWPARRSGQPGAAASQASQAQRPARRSRLAWLAAGRAKVGILSTRSAGVS